MAQNDWRLRRATVATLAEHGDAIESLIRTLRDQHHDLAVLSSALDLLAISDVDVVAPLVSFLDAPDANLRSRSRSFSANAAMSGRSLRCWRGWRIPI